MKQGDPWKDVPEERRLDFEVIREPLATLAEATLNKIEREWPAGLAGISGARVLFQLLAYIALTTNQTITYICAEKPDDPRRKIEFVDSAPPLLRSLADAIFTVVFIAEDIPERVRAYYRGGWREVAELDAAYRARYGSDPAWQEWLTAHAEFVATLQRDNGITEAEVLNPRSIQYWPIPSQMKPQCRKPETRAFLEYLDAWFYRQLSQETHLSCPGLSHRGGMFLRPKDDPLRESMWMKKRSDAVVLAVTLLLAFLTEVNAALGFDLGPRCAYLWGVLRQYLPIAEELYVARYRDLLRT